MNKIRDFTVPEFNRFRELCNFTDEEREVFELRAKDKTISQIAYDMNISEPKVSILIKRVKKKMIRVI